MELSNIVVPLAKRLITCNVKVPASLRDTYPNILSDISEHFARYVYGGIVIGLDSDPDLMTGIKSDGNPHYHLVFISSHTQEQLKKRREKLKYKQQKITMSVGNDPIITPEQVLQFYGYAVKDVPVQCVDLTNHNYIYLEIFDNYKVEWKAIEPFSIAAKQKKINLKNRENYKKEKEKKKTNETEEILEYLHAHVFSICSSDDKKATILNYLIEYQIEKDKYLDNYMCIRLYHKYLMKYRHDLQLDIDMIRMLRFDSRYN